MDKISIILSVVGTAALVIFLAPSIIAMNRGKVLRNIALWLMIIVALALYYQNIGPGRGQEHPTQFHLPGMLSTQPPIEPGASPHPDVNSKAL